MSDPNAASRTAPRASADPIEAYVVERALSVVRTLVAVACLLVVRLDPSVVPGEVRFTTPLLMAYAGFAFGLLVALLVVRQIPTRLAFFVCAVDTGFAAALALFSGGLGTVLFTLLLYSIFSAAYRWGSRAAIATAVLIDVLWGTEAVLFPLLMRLSGSTADLIPLKDFVFRAVYVALLGVVVGYLANSVDQRRFQSESLSSLVARARGEGRFAETVSSVLTAARDVFGAAEVLLVVEEQATAQLWRWTSNAAGRDTPGLTEMAPARRDDYLFDVRGTAWHAAVRPWGFRHQPLAAAALDGMGHPLGAISPGLIGPFLALHPCRRLVAVSTSLDTEFAGRLFVLDPGAGMRGEPAARFALQVANQVGSLVYGQYLLRRLRTRAEALERARIARELHDGVTQSLLGLEMEVVVLHRRAENDAPQLADELLRFHRIVRKEVIAVRELMEGIRVGDVESGDLLHHLSEMTDRFGRYTGIAAHFATDGQPVALTPHVRRQIACIIHEALVNVRKHSDADHVMVRAEVQGSDWRISIEDDGRGFPFAGRLSQQELAAFRQGPRTIRDRVRLIQGLLTVDSKPGFGSRIEVAIPLRAGA